MSLEVPDITIGHQFDATFNSEEWGMPSVSHQVWLTDRMLSLQEIDTQFGTSLALAPPNPRLSEENLRGYIVLLSAHFQGFCRDLYTECAQIVAATLPFPLQVVAQTQFTASLALDRGNPNRISIQRDFDRFGTPLDLDGADPANHARLIDLRNLNEWRNIVAHHNAVPPGGLPSQADLQRWRNSCDGLATSLDGIMYHELQSILATAPWVP
jgi:hypothetical protein